MNPQDHLIREYRASDRAAVEQCIADLQDSSQIFNPHIADGSIAPVYLQYLLRKCGETSGEIFVVEAEDRVVGMVSVFARVKSSSADEDDYEYAHISDLVVLDGYRSRGLGRALIRRAEDHARSQGAKLLRIGVMAHNEGARSLYNRFGFDELFVMLQKDL
jgi:ribosomal protein S18 acetylase RimI-like enzyme